MLLHNNQANNIPVANLFGDISFYTKLKFGLKMLLNKLS